MHVILLHRQTLPPVYPTTPLAMPYSPAATATESDEEDNDLVMTKEEKDELNALSQKPPLFLPTASGLFEPVPKKGRRRSPSPPSPLDSSALSDSITLFEGLSPDSDRRGDPSPNGGLNVSLMLDRSMFQAPHEDHHSDQSADTAAAEEEPMDWDTMDQDVIQEIHTARRLLETGGAPCNEVQGPAQQIHQFQTR